ncbi:MAG: hypothetical protein FWC15_08435 [Fibromonadales bacterium]|nr:hypothetical protein [Fibromonadales bacterium]MCL2261361.1 hypothetical protein [Fibromonadales bacterium]
MFKDAMKSVESGERRVESYGKLFLFFFILNFQLSTLNSYAEPTVWKDGEFYIWSYGKRHISPGDFCFALRFENDKIGNPNCYEAGDWERDTTASLYAKWLNTNLSSRLQAEDLQPRHTHVKERLQSLRDRNLLFSTIKNDQVWYLLFDETSSEPKEIAVFPLSMDSAKIARKIASDWFSGTPRVRLSDSDRAAKQKEPDEYYGEQPMHDVWLGIGTGWSRAKVPLTPNSWYKNTLNSRIKNYRDVRDSVSAWSFVDDSSPFLVAYIGGSVYDFIGLELEIHRSSHKAKIDESEEVYNELSSWSFNRYELLLSLIFMHVFNPHPKIEIEPYASASVIFSWFEEDIALKKGYSGSQPYKDRFEFESYYRGVAMNLGLRTAFFKNYAINLRTGIANRGTSMVAREIIASSTTDVYVAAGLEYHFRWR